MIEHFCTFTTATSYGFVLGLIAMITTMTLAFEFLSLTYKSWIRFMRFLSIWKAGWPPAHCDADGDSVPPTENK